MLKWLAAHDYSPRDDGAFMAPADSDLPDFPSHIWLDWGTTSSYVKYELPHELVVTTYEEAE